MRVFVVVNRVVEIGYRQTTALLIASLINQGHEVQLANVDGFSFVGFADRSEFSIKGLSFESNQTEQQIGSKGIESFVNSGDVTEKRYVLKRTR